LRSREEDSRADALGIPELLVSETQWKNTHIYFPRDLRISGFEAVSTSIVLFFHLLPGLRLAAF